MISVNDFMLKHKVSLEELGSLTGMTSRNLYDFKLEKREPTKTFQILLEKLDKEKDVTGVKQLKSELNTDILACIDKHFKSTVSLEDPTTMVAKLNIIIKYRKAFENLD